MSNYTSIYLESLCLHKQIFDQAEKAIRCRQALSDIENVESQQLRAEAYLAALQEERHLLEQVRHEAQQISEGPSLFFSWLLAIANSSGRISSSWMGANP